MIKQAKTILNDTFGYDEFRPLQEEVIDQVLQKNDALVIMPTGGGKSICYQIPSMIFDGLTIVISPLISLMKDQVEQLREFGIPAVCLNSAIDEERYEENVRRVINGDVKLLYMAPETLLMERTRKILDQVNVDLFTIDEAHCISEWGHDFRPDYRQMADVRKHFPNASCMALTATATPRVREDIKKTLEVGDAETFVASFNRENLMLKVVDKEDPTDQILDFLYTRKNKSGIIYCFSRRQVDELTSELRSEGISARPYHAGLSEKRRDSNQEAFIKDDTDIIVATIAFGMGINKPDVRFVIHHDMPKNIESYYQQIGRAGRDGVKSDCLLLFDHSDKQKIRYFINQKEGREKRVAEEHLKKLVQFLEYTDCRRKPLLEYFGETYQEDNCAMCDNCLALDEDMEDLTVPAQMFLSCVVRTGQRFGSHYIADVLRGSEAKKVLKNNHDQLSTHGIGRDLSKTQWIQLSRLLIRHKLLRKDPEFGGLELENGAKEVLRGEERVVGQMDRTKTASSDVAAARTSNTVESEYNEDLFQLLREKRKELADEKNVPPYVIFPDTTLMEMSYYYPKSEESMEEIYGVGSVKLKRYGEEFLHEIKQFCEKHNLEERQQDIARKAKKHSGKKRYQVVGEEFNSGKSIEHLSEQYGVKTSTILRHLKDYIDEDGNTLRKNGIAEASELSKRKQDVVMEAMDELNPDMLRPVYDHLDKEVPYNELRVMQLLYLAKNGDKD